MKIQMSLISILFPLHFLQEGKKYQALIVKDSMDSDQYP